MSLLTPIRPAPGTPLPAWALGPFRRRTNAGPILRPNASSTFSCPMRNGPVAWEALHAFNPAAIVRNGEVCLLYRAEDNTGDMGIGRHTSRLGLARSSDGIRFTCLPDPVLFPDNDDQKPHEWDGGCEDPRIVESPDGTYVVTYTQWARRLPRLAVATSTDLLHWKKHGSAFARNNHPCYADLDIKAGSIVTSLQQGRLKAVQIHGKYWMYWGENAIRLAWSHDLLNWTIVEDKLPEPQGNPKPGPSVTAQPASPITYGEGTPEKVLPRRPTVVLAARPGHFDSPLVEAGPPAVLTDHGIVLLYNAKTDGRHSEPDLAPEAYAGGQALFDADNPARLIERLPSPFVKPAASFERTGQYAAGTTFIEGLVRFRDQWLLYYGCADSMVGVVAAD